MSSFWGTAQKDILNSAFKEDLDKRNDSKFTDLYSKIEDAIEKSLNNKNITKDYDFMQGVTWYKTKRNIRFDKTEDEYYELKLYCGMSDKGSKGLRLITEYSGKDWIFIEQIQLKNVNGKEVKFALKRDRESEVHTGSVLEWADVSVESKISDIKTVLESDVIFVRLEGKYVSDWEMTKEQRTEFKEMIDVFESLDSIK